MPRPSRKSQAEKRERKSSAKVAAVPKATAEETVPSSPTQIPSTDGLNKEDADETVKKIQEEPGDVIEERLNVPTEEQVLAFSVLWAKSYLTEMVEGHVLCLDGGDEAEEACGTEDSEAMPTASDPWLQGCMSVVKVPPQRQTSSKQRVTDITQPTGPKPDESTARRRCNAVTQLARSSPQQHKKDSSLSGTDRNGHFKVLRPPLPLKPKKQKINLTSRPLPGQLLPPITASAERDDIKVKGESKALLAPNKTGSLHRPKNHCPIPKLDPSCLPQHCILPQHVVLENIKPTKSQKPSGKQSQSAKLEPVRKRQTEWTTASSGPLGTFLTRDESDLSQSKFSSSTFERSRERMTSSGPLRLDEMVLAEGVSLLDPPRDGKSCLQWKPPGVCMNLNPIQSEAVVPLYSVEQVVAGPPQVIPLSQPQK